ncbi:thiamine-phosphate kinase [Zhihengliuella alba]|uniref:Thiamine-monophosphate kinase n=1 Tax=Zhihengliuella alba TaxID=547018 RepID=A0ABP7CM17_9MICC
MSAGFTEHELIETLLRGYRSAKPILGPGDDAGILAVPDGRLVTTVDTITEDQDFRRIWPCGYRTTGYDVGWKSVAQNLSDINAMGARPTGIVTSLSLPADIGLDWVESFAAGVTDSIDQLGAHDCAIIGGDVGRGREISVTTTAFGSLDGGEPVLRSGAKPGDILAVCGTLGLGAAGVDLLDHRSSGRHESEVMGQRISDSSPEPVYSVALAQLRPRPPIGAGPSARMAGARAMLDISDGLIQDAARVAEASGLCIHLQSVACAEPPELTQVAQYLEGDARRWVFTGGEDFALLAAFDPRPGPPPGWRHVGWAETGRGVRIDAQPAQSWLAENLDGLRPGWDPFA